MRTLGLGHVTASGVGLIIGAGIYVLLAGATERAGAAVWLSFVVAGGLSALTAFSYAELASMFPEAGAEYDYTRRVAPPWLAFLVGWTMIVALVIAAAAVALGFANYANHFMDVEPRFVAWTVLAFVTVVALTGIENSARLTVGLSLLQVAGLVAVIAVGLPSVGDVPLLEGASAGGVVGGAALVFFAFIGFDEVITLAEETVDPVRTIPRALLLALGISTGLYVAVAITAVSVLGPVALAASPQPLADVMAESFGDQGAHIVALVAMVATTNTALLALTAASRVQYGMAGSGALPEPVSRLNERRVPALAMLLGAGTSAAFVGVGDISYVASVTDFAVYVVFVAVNATVIVLRIRQPDVPRPFRIPGAVGRVPVMPVLSLVTIALLVPSLGVRTLVTGTGCVIVGMTVHVRLGASRSR